MGGVYENEMASHSICVLKLYKEPEMTDDESGHPHEDRKNRPMKHNETFGAIYGMAFIGAAIYFIGHATSFWVGVLGFFKAVFWPAVLMYKVLELLRM